MAYNSSHASPGASGMKSSQQGSVQEFSIRVPKNNKKKFHVMRFNSNLGVDFVKWKSQNMQIKMERENNMKEFKGQEEEMPKFGAGSEFGREQREEARRKKYGYVARKYKPEDQPWILKQGGKSGKKFKGIREGGVSDNTAYYVFTQAGNGVIEAYPLQEWYKFQPIQRYKSLSAEEAEAEFGRRNKIINYFSLMMKKRLRNEEDGDLDDPDEVKGKKGGSKKKDKGELKISEMDDWVDSDEFSDSDEEGKKSDEDDDDGRKKNKKKGNKKGAPKKKKKGSDESAFEESDDGDEEGRELDYISDSSESASDHEMKANKELKGVAEEDALRKLLNSESEDEEENEEKKDEEASNSEDEESKNKKEKDEKDGGEKTKEESSKKKKPSKKDKKSNSKNDKKAGKKNDGESSSELSPNSTDTDSDGGAPKNKPSNKTKDATNSAGSSRSATPTPAPVPGGKKRKLTPSELAVAAAKKAKLESSSSSGSLNLLNNGESGITEDAVRRYLMRKPMTATELLQKFKSKKSGLSSDQMVNVIAQILKNINPHKQVIKNKMYWSISPT